LAILKLKMAANSTYWRAKLISDDLWHVATGEKIRFLSFFYLQALTSRDLKRIPPGHIPESYIMSGRTSIGATTDAIIALIHFDIAAPAFGFGICWAGFLSSSGSIGTK
jgi:nitroreductase